MIYIYISSLYGNVDNNCYINNLIMTSKNAYEKNYYNLVYRNISVPVNIYAYT